MKSVEFCYWLQGLFELGQPVSLDAEQTASVKAHLAMVFVHEIDPSYPPAQKPALDAAHNGHLDHLRPHQGRDDVIIRC